ncbi:PilW family protein [Massilia sp. W12]|uniref:PilW family protein n=1 Tax=Massilia sp. W12 TaxID=3126507 RepID=UPI0030D4DCF7
MHATATYPAKHRSGFSLIEVLVGLAIGMLGMLVMLQVFNLTDSGKRATTSGDDAQTSGALAIYSLQRDIRQGGFGFTARNLLGCSLRLESGVTLPAIGATIINPGTDVIPAGDSNSDTLLVYVGNGMGIPSGDRINGHPSPDNFRMVSPALFNINTRVIPGPDSTAFPCARTMTRVVATDPGGVTTAAGDATVTVRDWLFDVGLSPRILAYAVRNSRLMQCDFMQNDCRTGLSDPAIWQAVADNVVSMRARYAKQTVSRGGASQWDQVTPLPTESFASWQNILGIQLALVARSAQYEKTAVTLATPSWQGSATLPLNLSHLSDWQHYRYKIFETTIPIRNITQ